MKFCSVSVQGTCVACCPVAQYAAVGTASGDVLFVDLKREQQPRLVHKVHLDHSVDQIVQVSQFPGVSFTLYKCVWKKPNVCVPFKCFSFTVLIKRDTIFSSEPQTHTSLL